MKKMIVCFAAAGAIMAACGGAKERTAVVADDAAVVELRDFGAEPTVIDIERYTLANDNFRTALWTGGNLQLTLMSVPAGGQVGLECHDGIDQFLRVESGCGRVEMGDSRARGGRGFRDHSAGRQVAQHYQYGRCTSEIILDLRTGRACARHCTPHLRGGHASRSRARPCDRDVTGVRQRRVPSYGRPNSAFTITGLYGKYCIQNLTPAGAYAGGGYYFCGSLASRCFR